MMIAPQPFNSFGSSSREIKTLAVGLAASKARVNANMNMSATKKDLDIIDRFLERKLGNKDLKYKKKDLDFVDNFLQKKGFPQK